jgi:hypothetical protein
MFFYVRKILKFWILDQISRNDITLDNINETSADRLNTSYA